MSFLLQNLTQGIVDRDVNQRMRTGSLKLSIAQMGV